MNIKKKNIFSFLTIMKNFFRKVENIFWECSQKGILDLFINESMNEYQKEEYIFLFDNYEKLF